MPILSAVVGLAAAFAATAAYMLPGSGEARPDAASQALVEAKDTAASTTSVIEDVTATAAPTAADVDVASIKDTPDAAVRSAPAEVQNVVADTPAVQIPTSENPRWAKSTAPSGAAALAAVKALMAEGGSSQETESAPSVMAYASPETASTVPPQSIDEAASLDPAAGKVKAPEDPMPDAEQARVNTAVNMRSGPGSEHGVILVIPGNSPVQLYSCNSWCKVGYDGRTGYIYKSFLGGKKASRTSTKKTVRKKQAEEPVKTVSVVSTVEEQKPAAVPAVPATNPVRGR